MCSCISGPHAHARRLSESLCARYRMTCCPGTDYPLRRSALRWTSRPPDGQAFARVEDARGLDVGNDVAFLAQLVHRPSDTDPGHQLLLSSVFDLAHGDVLPLHLSALTNLLCP